MTLSESLRLEAGQLHEEVAHWRRRLSGTARLLDRHNPAHGHRVLLLSLRYVLGSSRDQTTTVHHQKGEPG